MTMNHNHNHDPNDNQTQSRNHARTSMARPAGTPPRIGAADLARVVDGEDVPGVDPTHPGIQRLRKGLPEVKAQEAFMRARITGYLFIDRARYTTPWMVEQLELVWGWWCMAAARPDIVVHTEGANRAWLRCDLSPRGRDWTLGAFAEIGKLLEGIEEREEEGWLFTADELLMDGLTIEEARRIAWGLAHLVKRGRSLVGG